MISKRCRIITHMDRIGYNLGRGPKGLKQLKQSISLLEDLQEHQSCWNPRLGNKRLMSYRLSLIKALKDVINRSKR
jgi:hypothetical protein